MMASVSGRRTMTVVPTPSLALDARRCRAARSMLRLTTSMPTPRPDRLVTWSAVEKPGSKIRS